jgi:hypothetical protein
VTALSYKPLNSTLSLAFLLQKFSAEQIKTGEGGIKSEETTEFDKSAGSMQKANKELKEEMNLDFEEISDGELEEELKFKGASHFIFIDQGEY